MADDASLPLVVVMGVSGSGKSTIAAGLAKRLGVTFVEGDDLHPHANVEKMAGGIPLTDDDRWPWLRAVGQAMEAVRQGEGGVVVSCSALKRAYRDCIRAEVNGLVRFVLLTGSRAVIAGRMAGRKGHFMPTTLLDSQFATLELPGSDENAVTLDVAQSIEALVDQAFTAVSGKPAQKENK